MKPLTTFARFWYDFIVGDDWRLAAGTVAAVTLAWLGAARHVNVWWILPVMVSVLLGGSVSLATRMKPLSRDENQQSDEMA
jgi:hypothetical protein